MRTKLVAVSLSAVGLFLFLVPIIAMGTVTWYMLPFGCDSHVSGCGINAVGQHQYGSATYWLTQVGGVAVGSTYIVGIFGVPGLCLSTTLNLCSQLDLAQFATQATLDILYLTAAVMASVVGLSSFVLYKFYFAKKVRTD